MSNKTLLEIFSNRVKYYSEHDLDYGFNVNPENHILYLKYRDAGFLHITNTRHCATFVTINIKLTEKGQAIRDMAML